MFDNESLRRGHELPRSDIKLSSTEAMHRNDA
jgi:hypothetical protein